MRYFVILVLVGLGFVIPQAFGINENLFSGTTTFSSYAGAGNWIGLFTNPDDADSVNILGIRLNSNFDIGSFSWNGTSYSNYGDSQITFDTTVSTFESFSLDFVN